MTTTDRLAYSVPEFCAAVGISRAHLYNELKAGRGPRICKLGNRTIVTVQDARAYLASLPVAADAKDAA